MPQELVASALTFEAAEDLEAPAPSALVAGGARLFRQTLVDEGVSDEWADRLSQMVEMHAARGLYQRTPPALPSSFVEAARRAG